MATLTYQEQLEEVQTAITNVLTHGQSLMKDGRMVTLASLADLESREKYLRSLVRREANGGKIRTFGVRPL